MNEDPDKRELDHVKQARAIATLREHLPAITDLMRIEASVTRSRFVALVEAGFTEAQALELCKSGPFGAQIGGGQ